MGVIQQNIKRHPKQDFRVLKQDLIILFKQFLFFFGKRVELNSWYFLFCVCESEYEQFKCLFFVIAVKVKNIFNFLRSQITVKRGNRKHLI